MALMCALPLEHEIEYPTSDGQPMAETTLHRKVMSDLIEALERRYADAPDVWTGGNLFLCYRRGDPSAIVAPDVLHARGVVKYERDNYLLWEEVPPALIFEITSRSTRREDLGPKKSLYERLGVEELVLFDPYGEYLRPRLRGFRLARGRYQPIAAAEDGALDLQTVGLTLRPEGNRLRLADSATGELLLWTDEIAAARARAEERAEAAEERAEAAQVQAEAARQQAAAAEERAEAESRARRLAEEHAQALTEELARLRAAKP
jgi:Uma2 family endonuclease